MTELISAQILTAGGAGIRACQSSPDPDQAVIGFRSMGLDTGSGTRAPESGLFSTREVDETPLYSASPEGRKECLISF